ncbi:unnamed protein product [Rhizophagus irregularis]|nr:unnamed protein product [Rhizophagus irregularis]
MNFTNSRLRAICVTNYESNSSQQNTIIPTKYNTKHDPNSETLLKATRIARVYEKKISALFSRSPRPLEKKKSDGENQRERNRK